MTNFVNISSLTPPSSAKAMPVQQSQDKITLTHPKGASVEILLYGATIISWKAPSKSSSTPEERLFVSSKAALDGSKPVRGGIPVVFPCFGAPTHPEHTKLAQHGFARNEVWKYDSTVMDNEAGVSVKLTLEPNDRIRQVYNREFSLAYVVTLAEHQLSTDIHVTNPSSASSPIEFQALLHTYHRANSSQVRILPLNGLQYFDKTAPAAESNKTETRQEVDVATFTDSVYENAGGDYIVKWGNQGVQIKAVGFKDVVVWNPQASAGSKIGDMEDGGWEKFVCVEPGYVRGFAKVEPGDRWIGQQVISIL